MMPPRYPPTVVDFPAGNGHVSLSRTGRELSGKENTGDLVTLSVRIGKRTVMVDMSPDTAKVLAAALGVVAG